MQGVSNAQTVGAAIAIAPYLMAAAPAVMSGMMESVASTGAGTTIMSGFLGGAGHGLVDNYVRNKTRSPENNYKGESFGQWITPKNAGPIAESVGDMFNPGAIIGGGLPSIINRSRGLVNKVYNSAVAAKNKYFFNQREGTYTRGLGMGTEGVEDLTRSGVVRGNPRGTEVTANQFTKMYNRNRDHFRDVIEATGIKGLESKFFSRTLTKEEFEAIKAASKKFTTKRLNRDLTTREVPADPLSNYATYDDYLRTIADDVAAVEQMPNRIARGEVPVNRELTMSEDGVLTGQPINERFGANSDYVADGTPLSYWYDDGRNPFTRGHDYAGSNWAVRVNNPEEYTPFMHKLHLHPSFMKSPVLADPGVEVFKRGPFGIGLRVNKDTLRPLLFEDLSRNPISRSYKNITSLRKSWNDRDILGFLENPISRSLLENRSLRRQLAHTPIGKRAIELAMRTTASPNPVPEIFEALNAGGFGRAQRDYLLFGKNPYLRKLFNRPAFKFGDNSLSTGTPYRGLYGETKMIPNTSPDVIDTFLYGIPMDKRIARLSPLSEYGIHEGYIRRNYPNKRVPVYEIGEPLEGVMPTTEWMGSKEPRFNAFKIAGEESPEINVGGHMMRFGDYNGTTMQQAQDIWKFLPEDYKHKWNLQSELDNYMGRPIPEWLTNAGLDIVNEAGTPIIFRQHWRPLYE